MKRATVMRKALRAAIRQGALESFFDCKILSAAMPFSF
jgi:predicted DNA-binding protein (UPF0278 family)